MQKLQVFKTKDDRMKLRKELLKQRMINNIRNLKNVNQVKINLGIPLTDLDRMKETTVGNILETARSGDKLITKETTSKTNDDSKKVLFENLKKMADNETANKIHAELLTYLNAEQIKTVNLIWAQIDNKSKKTFSRGVTIDKFVDFVIRLEEEYTNDTDTTAQDLKTKIITTNEQNARDKKIKDDKDAKDTKDAKDAKDTKDKQDKQDTKDAKDAKDAQDAKDKQDAKDAKDAKDKQDADDKNEQIAELEKKMALFEAELVQLKDGATQLNKEIKKKTTKFEKDTEKLNLSFAALGMAEQGLNKTKQRNIENENLISADGKQILNLDGDILKQQTKTLVKHINFVSEAQKLYDKQIMNVSKSKIANDQLQEELSETKTAIDANLDAQKDIKKEIAEVNKIAGSGIGFKKSQMNKQMKKTIIKKPKYKKLVNLKYGSGISNDNDSNKERYAQLEKFIINIDHLQKKNEIVVKYAKNRNIISKYPKTIVSDNVKNIVLSLLENDEINEKKYKELNTNDKLSLINFMNACHLDYEKYSIDDKNQIFKIMVGEIKAGNNSVQLKDNLKQFLIDSVIQKNITYNEAENILRTLKI